METTSGVTYREPKLNGPIEPKNPQFYKTQRWHVIQERDLGKSLLYNIFPKFKFKFKYFYYRKKLYIRNTRSKHNTYFK
jgi:hypothetical protein